MNMHTYHTSKSEQGFTIIELMIALSVLSVLLVMSTVLLIQIGSMYSKGVNMSAIQNADRNIVNDVASAIEFGSAQPQFGSVLAAIGGKPVTIYSICLDTKRYSYIVDSQVSNSPDSTLTPPQNYHALWEDTMQNAGQCLPMNITAATPTNPAPPGVPTSTVAGQAGQELVPLHSRLSAFSVTQQPDGNGGYIYNIAADLAYGDNDLLTTSGGKTLCKGDSGQEYCATSHLSTAVTRRLK